MSFYKRRNSWIRRRWLDFRQGHSIYLVFVMTFANFITIQYALMIERIPALATVFGNLWIFAIGFISLYIPLSIMIGYWHRRTQWKVEQEAMFNENIVQARLWLFLINLIDGKVTDQERQEMRERLQKIIKKLPHDLQQEKKPN
jgi:hypothetical protein